MRIKKRYCPGCGVHVTGPAWVLYCSKGKQRCLREQKKAKSAPPPAAGEPWVEPEAPVEDLGEPDELEDEPAEVVVEDKPEVPAEEEPVGRIKRTWPEDLGPEQVKAYREAHGLSRTALAKLIGDCTGSAVAAWEDGSSAPRAGTLERLRAVLAGPPVAAEPVIPVPPPHPRGAFRAARCARLAGARPGSSCLGARAGG